MIEIEDAFIAHSAMLCTRTDPGVTNSTMELELLCHSFWIHLQQFCARLEAEFANFHLSFVILLYLLPSINHWISCVGDVTPDHIICHKCYPNHNESADWRYLLYSLILVLRDRLHDLYRQDNGTEDKLKDHQYLEGRWRSLASVSSESVLIDLHNHLRFCWSLLIQLQILTLIRLL